jgi:two-component system OmpR family response regulator
VDWARNGQDGRELGRTEAYDAVILDLGLPDISGLDILKYWRARGIEHPVLILTSRNAWTEKVEGLNAGADDYVGKPVEAGEIAARLHALIRRRHGRADPVLRRGAIELRPSEGSVLVGGKTVDLTAQELRILHYLMQRPGRIVSEPEIADHVYDMDSPRQSNGIQVYVGRLRRKLGRDVIRTYRGMGYRFE